MPPRFLSPSSTRGRPRNRLLAQLSDHDFQQVRLHLQTVSLDAKQILHKQGDRLRYVYFPNGGVVFMALLLPEGSRVETATIGDDGIVGVEAYFGGDALSACETIVEVPGSAERMSVQDFRRELAARPTLRHAVSQYVEVLYAVMARLMACNVHHRMEGRCARWLLIMHDRMQGRDFYSSHDCLAAMLGVRRQSVSAACGTLRRAGLIGYVHGHVTVLDRKNLERAACDCYRAIRALQDRLRS